MTENPEDGAGPLPVGHVLASRYTLEEVMGQGPFGWLYRAADAERDEPVILYVLGEGVAGPGGSLEFKLWLAALHRRGGQDIYDYANVEGVRFVALRCEHGRGIAREIAESVAFHEARRGAEDGGGAKAERADGAVEQGDESGES